MGVIESVTSIITFFKLLFKLLPKVFFSSGSKDWHHGRRDTSLLCTTCHTHESKHGSLPPASKSAVAPFLFKPAKEEEEVNNKHGMRTRRSRAPVSLRPIQLYLSLNKPSKESVRATYIYNDHIQEISHPHLSK